MMAARRNARKSKKCRATIQDGMMFFSGDSLSNAKPIPEEDCEEWVLGVALAQYLITAGLKKFKQKGENGVTKELTQITDMNVFTPVLKESLSSKKRAKALALLMFLKEKRDKTGVTHSHQIGIHHSGGERARGTRHRMLRHPWSIPPCKF